MTYTVAKAPCKSCPYRQDVPSGVWSEEEYDKLPKFDGEIIDQVMNEAFGVFLCHQTDGNLCAGWVGCHGAENLLGLRMTRNPIDEAVWAYESPIPLFASGQEACDHGKKQIDEPGDKALGLITQISRKRGL